VVGDILMIEAGDIIRIDGILIVSNELKVNETKFLSKKK